MIDNNSNTMNTALAGTVKLLGLKKIDDATFEGIKNKTTNTRIFGGQVVSQALMAASATVDGRPAISLKSDFLRAGDPNQTVIYSVENVRDGRSFNTRRVVARQIQKGKQQIIFTLNASFHQPENGVQHQINMDEYPKPLDLPSLADNFEKIKDQIPESAKQSYESDQAFDERLVVFINPVKPEKCEPKYAVWYKSNGTIDHNNAMHQGLFAFVSDMCLLKSCFLPHGLSWHQDNLQSASLDHSIWFHREFRVDQWMLFICDSPVSYGARGFNRASVYRENGDLIASLTQEGLIRVND